jgi:hypothetical protein
MLISGEFGEANPLRNVIWSILKEKGVEFGVLWISSPGHEIVGEIGVQWGIYIIGGRVRGANGTGQEAVRHLLTLPKGTYQYIDYSQSFVPELGQGVRIRLSDLANTKSDIANVLDKAAGNRESKTRMRALVAAPPKPATAPEAPYFSRSWVANQEVVVQVGNWERTTMHLRTLAFWSAFFAFACVATLMACCNR